MNDTRPEALRAVARALEDGAKKLLERARARTRAIIAILEGGHNGTCIPRERTERTGRLVRVARP